jgi:hypothetical protein
MSNVRVFLEIVDLWVVGCGNEREDEGNSCICIREIN